MPAVIPGLGVATPLIELPGRYRVLIQNIATVIERHPTARVVRNRVGNLSIVVEGDGDWVDCWGFIDVRTGDVELYDEPWPIERAEGARCQSDETRQHKIDTTSATVNP